MAKTTKTKTAKKPATKTKAKAAPAKASKTKAVAGKEKASAKKATKKGSEKELTPIQKAQLARAAGKKSGKTKSKKKARPVFKAPTDMKPIFIKADVSLGKDGHMTQSRVTAIKGKLGSDTAKIVPLGAYDLNTQNSVVARLAGPMFIKSEKKRLSPGLQLSAVFRIGKSKKTGGVAVRLKEVKAKMPEKKAKTLDKKDPIYRTVRKSARPLEAAFTRLQPFPSNKEIKAMTEKEAA